MTSASCNPRVAYDCVQMMSNHYPERLGLILCIGPGTAFKLVYKTIKPFIPSATAKKLVIVGHKSNLSSNLSQYFPSDLTRWFVREYQLNRSKSTGEGHLEFEPFWCGPRDTESDHDRRGTKMYVKEWVQVSHPTGHLAHPNVLDCLAGRLKPPPGLSIAAPKTSLEPGEDCTDSDAETDDDLTTMGNFYSSLPTEYQLPDNAKQLS